MTRTARLTVVLALNLALVAGLVVVGAASGSVAVWAEGLDYLADAAAVAITLLALRLANRPAASRRNRHVRAPAVAALVNAGWLAALCLFVIVSATRRLLAGAHLVQGLPMLVVSGIAALAMLVGAWLLGGDPDADESDVGERPADSAGGRLAVRAVLLDTVADAAAAAGVAVTGAVIWVVSGWYWLDPAVALVVAVVVVYHAGKLVAEAVGRLRTAPR